MHMRLLLGPAVVVVVVGMLLTAPQTAAAQKPEENYVADSWYNFEINPADTVMMRDRRQMAQSAAALVAAENIFYTRNGRYTAKMQDLANWEPAQNISLFVTAGGTWLSIRAVSSESPSSSRELNVLAWRGDGPRVESGHFSRLLSTGRR